MRSQKLLLCLLISLSVVLLAFSLHGCRRNQPTIATHTTSSTDDEGSTNLPAMPTDQSQPSSLTENPTGQPTQIQGPAQTEFPPPSFIPATPIPPAMDGLVLDDDILVWVLLGSDTEPPFSGQIQAIHLLFINPRFSKASLVSIPGDLFVYIPGYTMQRLNIAYAVGGIETLRMTLAYNFGVVPSRFVLAHPGDFQWLVDDLKGIEITVFFPIPHACGGIRAGLVQMDGSLALCYASYRDGMDEIDRMSRQQQLLRVIFRKLTHDGNLIQLPILFASYQGWVKTDFDLPELMGYIPLALRLADPDRIGYYMLGWDQISIWEVPGYSQAKVFLPNQDQVRVVLQNAIDDLMSPSPLTNQVQTLEAQLTAAYQATATAFGQASPTPPITQTPSVTLQGTEILSTPSPTATLSTPSPTATLITPSPTTTLITPSPTATVTPPENP
jgi:polyisoprenyl-teichoic acid--peptidoglycan teichoic acid transferase